MATRTAIVEGDRNVLITAPTNNALIVTGDRNTVEMKLDGAGAALAFAFRWNRPKARRRRDRPAPPPRLEQHVDREREVDVLAAATDPPRVVNVYGEPGVGKTHVLVEALNRRECELRDGTVYLDGRGRDADDLLHAVFEALFETRLPLRAQQIERHLGDRRAVLALENVQIAPEDSQRLALATPACRLLLTSSERVLFEGVALALAGLAPEHGAAIAEQELGRALSGRERAAAESVSEGLHGHPLRLRQTFGRARDAGLRIDQLAPRAASAYDRAQALTAQERSVARVLAVHGDAPLGVEHIEAIAGPGAGEIAAQLEARHEARSHSPRYSLPGDLARALQDGFRLDAELDHALAHFADWARAEARAGRRDRVLLEADALVALLERAHALGSDREVVRLGVAIEGALAWGNRWEAWRRVLELVLAAARASGDGWAEGAALHQLGTRAYGAGDAAAAQRLLEQALARREQIGDTAGARTTRQNLRVVGGGPPLLYKLSHLPLAIVATIAAVLVIGAAAATGAGSSDRDDDTDTTDVVRTAQLSVAVAGQGSIVSAPAAIDCPRTCEAGVSRGRTVVLTARHAGGSDFAGWSGACSRARTRPRCTVTMDGPRRVAARFAPRRTGGGGDLRVSIRTTGSGSGRISGPTGSGLDCTSSCDASFPAATAAVTLRASADAGSTFVGWGGACPGTDATCEVVLAGRATIVRPRFDLKEVDEGLLLVRVEGAELGTVTSDPKGLDCRRECRAPFPLGRAVALNAAADTGSRFVGWRGIAGCEAAPTCVVTVDDATAVTAVFAKRAIHTLTTQVRQAPAVWEIRTSADTDTVGRNCSSGCDYSAGSEIEVKVSADDPVQTWTGCASSTKTTCRLTLTGDTTVTADFGISSVD